MKWRRKSDKPSPRLVEYIQRRDKRCIASRVDSDHICRNQRGEEHMPDDLRYLTLDHVLDAARMGRRAKSDRKHLVLACWDANVNGWCSAHREEERAYLRMVET